MNLRRGFFHPVMFHRRGRFIFLWYVSAALLASAALWWQLDVLLVSAGISTGPHWLMSGVFRAAAVVGCALFASAVTAPALSGPVQRIELWLEERRSGRSKVLRVRSGDAFETLIRLLNELHLRNLAPPRPKRAPRKRTPSPRPPKLRAL
jgi:hypothetical protein